MARIPLWFFLVWVVLAAPAMQPYAPSFAKSVAFLVKVLAYVLFDVDLRR